MNDVLSERSPAASTNRVEAVIVRLRDMILKGEVAAGHHMQEIPLAEQLGVSRTPIHEALVLLAMEGLLEEGPRRGYKVRSFSLQEVIQAYEIRGTLEGMACRMLAERGIPPEQARAFQAILDHGDSMLSAGMFDERDQGEWLGMNYSFHDLVVQAVSNPLLLSCISLVHNVPLSSARHVPWYSMDQHNFDMAKGAHREHHEIVKCILGREGTRAEMLMREHIRFAQDLVQTHFKDEVIGFGTVLPLAAGR